MSDIYMECYRVLFSTVLPHRPVYNGFDFVFDNKEKVKGRVLKHFETVKRDFDQMPDFAGKLNSCSFRDDREVIPLQAADLLAYEVRRHAWQRVTSELEELRYAYRRLKESFQQNPPEPPYRARVFRCYDARFFVSLIKQALAMPQPLSASDMHDPWLYLEAPED